MLGASGSPRRVELGGRAWTTIPCHLMKFEGDMGQLALLSRPFCGFHFCVVLGRGCSGVPAGSPRGRVHRAARGRA